MNGWLPQGAATGIGSLPHTDSGEAVRVALRDAPSVPFWPQLPRRDEGEGMLAQALAPVLPLLVRKPHGAGYCLRAPLDDVLGALAEAPADLEASHAAGWSALMSAAERGELDGAEALKGQLTGPATLALTLFRGGRGRALRPFADHPRLIEALGAYVARRAAWQAERLVALGRPAVVFVDEPALGTLQRAVSPALRPAVSRAVARVCEAIRAAGAMAGLHCCAAFDDALLEPAPDVLSVDVHRSPAAVCVQPALRRFVERGGLIALGLVPTGAALDGLGAKQVFVQWLQAASLLGDPQQVARQTLVTATCGLGLLEEASAEQALRLGHETGRMVRSVAAGQIAVTPRAR